MKEDKFIRVYHAGDIFYITRESFWSKTADMPVNDYVLSITENTASTFSDGELPVVKKYFSMKSAFDGAVFMLENTMPVTVEELWNL